MTWRTPPMYLSRPCSNPRLNAPKNPFFGASPLLAGLNIMAHNAGVSDNATNTESNIAETIVSENWR